MKRINIALTTGLFTALTLLATVPVVAKEWKTIRIATEGAYAPWNFHDAGGKLVGFEIDLAKELCKRAKVQCEIMAQDFSGAIPGLNAGKFDAIMAGMNINARRREAIDFSIPYAVVPLGFASPVSSPLAKLPRGKKFDLVKDAAGAQQAITELKSAFKGKTLGVLSATGSSAWVEKEFGDVVQLSRYKTAEQHDLDMKAGRIDAAVALETYWVATLAKPENQSLAMFGPLFVGGALGEGVAVGIRKREPELKKLLDDQIDAMKKDGALKTLMQKWFRADLTP
jgi:octopine/nopaline transport system substrate-binding protein